MMVLSLELLTWACSTEEKAEQTPEPAAESAKEIEAFESTPASTTNYHRREPTRVTYPPYGNGTEQWIAFTTPVNPMGKKLTAK